MWVLTTKLMVRYAGIQPFIFLNITNHEYFGISIHQPLGSRLDLQMLAVCYDTSQVGVKYISSTEYRGWYVFHMEEGIYI